MLLFILINGYNKKSYSVVSFVVTFSTFYFLLTHPTQRAGVIHITLSFDCMYLAQLLLEI